MLTNNMLSFIKLGEHLYIDKATKNLQNNDLNFKLVVDLCLGINKMKTYN